MITKILTGLRCPTYYTHMWTQSRTWLLCERWSIAPKHPLGVSPPCPGLWPPAGRSVLPTALRPTSGSRGPPRKPLLLFSVKDQTFSWHRSSPGSSLRDLQADGGAWGAALAPKCRPACALRRHGAHYSASSSAAQAIKSRKSTCPANGWD